MGAGPNLPTPSDTCVADQHELCRHSWRSSEQQVGCDVREGDDALDAPRLRLDDDQAPHA